MITIIKTKTSPDTKEDLINLLNPLVKQWFFSRFSKFSLPQLYGVAEIHKRNNILISAPTGATKTLTAFMSILNELVDSSQKGILENKIYCVYISPLKALNEDIKFNLIEPLSEMEKLAGKEPGDLGIRIAVRTGDTTQKEKADMLKNCPHILITTPETLAILLASTKFIEHLKNVQWVVVDEIHSLAENKRGVHLSVSLERLQRLSGHTARVGLSATIAPLDEIAKFLVGYDEGGNERDCLIVDVQFIKEMDLKVLCPVDDIIDASYNQMHTAMYGLMNDLIQQHKTTLIFTNTRAATERVVHNLKETYPKLYTDSNIGAHHGSLSKEHRFSLEDNLRKGRLKCVVCSTSLELGIDIGYIDLVLLLGSPKSVARALQRIGRSGHQLHAKTKGRIIVLDRDDLVECSVLLKSAVERKIDRIHIPRNCLDVLVQHVHGIALEGQIHFDDMYNLIKKSYCYSNLSKEDLLQIVEYLSGRYISLEDRHIYAKIWYDPETRIIGKKGMMSRVIHMTNIGTIPDESGIKVKVGEKVIGIIDEAFLERMKRNDIFVLGGSTYTFKFARGMTAQVEATVDRPPTIPAWFSDALPLSFDLALEIGKFRRLMEEHFKEKKSEKEILDFLNDYLYVDQKAANSIYGYFKEQYDYIKEMPTDNKILIEHYVDEHGNKYIVFHTLFGRRVNDCLSRAVAFAISRTQHKDVEMGVSDNGFYITTGSKKVQALRAFKLLKADELRKLMGNAIERSEILARRFRHCAGRAMMILRNYLGRTKNAGRQHLSSVILLNAVRRISPDFFILKEARREIFEDLMDIDSAERILTLISNGKIKIKEVSTEIPMPFSFNLVLQGHLDILKMEDKNEFLKKMHQNVLAKISLCRG